MMSRIEEIYQDFSSRQENEELKMRREQVNIKIQKTLKEWEKEVDRETYEMGVGKCMEIAETGERGGFIVGFRYAVQLMNECMGMHILKE